MMPLVKIVKSQYDPRKYEERSLHGEAVENRNPIIKEMKIRAIYEDDEVAIIQVMDKWDATHDEMAYVLMGDTLTKSHEVYDFIEKQVGAPAPGQTVGGAGTYGFEDGKAQMKPAGQMLGLGQGGEGAGGLSGGASQGTAGGNVQSHPAAQSQPGFWDRAKQWGKERAMPAMGRGLRHFGAFGAGGLAAGPAGALAGLGASMYQSHKAKQDPNNRNYQPVVGGPGGGAELAQQGVQAAGQAAKQFGQQQAQNFQQGGGVAGGVGQAAYAGQNLAGQAGAGLKRLGGAIAAPFKQAWQAGGGQQQANAAAAGQPQSPVASIGQSPTNAMPAVGVTDTTGQVAGANPAVAGQITGGGGQPNWQQGQGWGQQPAGPPNLFGQQAGATAAEQNMQQQP